MKKTVFFLAVLFVAGIFSAKAQSASDSAFVRDLNYTFINTSSLPVTVTGQLTSTTKILKDVRAGYVANGYAFSLTQTATIDFSLKPPVSGSWDCYLYLLDANYNVITYDDDYYFDSVRGSRIIRNLPAGSYYLLVSRFNLGRPSSNLDYTLTLSASTAVTLPSLTYTTVSLNTTITDSIVATTPIITDSAIEQSYGNYPRGKGYSVQLQPGLLSITASRNRYIYILDNNYNTVYYAQTNVTYNIATAGTYRFVVASNRGRYENDTTLGTFTVNLRSITPTALNALTYTPLGSAPDTIVYDTFASTFPFVSYDSQYYPAKGYSFQATQKSVIDIWDNSGYPAYILMDNNYNVISTEESGFYTQLPQTGTYYLAIIYYVGYESEVNIKNFPYQTLYVDGVNGNDARNGLTPNTALKTLDTAIARTIGIGRYYLTDDYTFGEYFRPYAYYAEIYPYQKDIRIKIPKNSSNYNDPFVVYRELIFGENGGSYYFIIDSSHNDLDDGLCYGYSYGTRIELNNVKVRNSYFPDDFITYADDVVIRNCEFSNDTIGDDFIQLSYTTFNSAKLIDVNFTQNYMDYYLVYKDNDDDYRAKFSMENTNIAGNTFEYPQMGFWRFDAELSSGSWRNNNLADSYYYNGNPNLSTQNCAGIWSFNSTINIGAGFTMDANNYICIDSASTLNIAENLTSPLVAQIYPYKWDDNSDYYVADYYEGRPVLWGSSSLLRANYNKFSIAQADNASLWYLHSDGKIYTTEEQIGIAQAEGADISIYPNPASDKVTIDLRNTAANEICVMDIYGKTVVRQAVSGQSQVLDLGNLAKGMYFVQIRNNGKVEATQKLVKK